MPEALQRAAPPAIEVGEGLAALHAAAVEGVFVLPEVETAVAWANAAIAQIESAKA